MNPADAPLPMAAPFVVLLLAIAILPLAARGWWEHNRNKGIVAALLAIPVAVWLVHAGMSSRLGGTALEYVSFIVLLGSLYTISGGIFLDGDLRALPRVNACFLAAGAVLASLIGTTGASMLLIRPLLRTNSERRHTVHTVVFFIFIVSNCGGCLTPLGDPPLFLGYLRGVPFAWTFQLWPVWLGVNVALLAIYFAWDTLAIRRETRAALRLDLARYEPMHLYGGANVVLLLGVVASAAFLPEHLGLLRDGVMAALALASLALTNRDVRTLNRFSWAPIAEVAVLFAGIFVTMVPALMILEAHGADLGVDTPRRFFWATGGLSSFLDNAPTYLTLSSASVGLLTQQGHAGLSAAHLDTLIRVPEGAAFLRAISLGAVLMGANTYIGNGPNFMVKAIADASGVRMPGFFGYMLYSAAVLIPVFLVLTWIAF